ncbi:MAG: hypothetical protein VX403_05890, partial [Planctomycetota bacterium]|nr:hypothetical protein [Planctomycetota bacterium]
QMSQAELEARWRQEQLAEKQALHGVLRIEQDEMAHAMRLALESGYHGARSERIGMRRYASASSPFDGVISTIPGE